MDPLKRKVVNRVFLVLIVTIVGVLAYGVVDQAVTIDHLGTEVRRVRAQTSLLRQLANDSLNLANEADIRSLVKSKYGLSHIVRDEGDVIYIDGVGLRVKGASLLEFVMLD